MRQSFLTTKTCYRSNLLSATSRGQLVIPSDTGYPITKPLLEILDIQTGLNLLKAMKIHQNNSPEKDHRLKIHSHGEMSN